MAKTWTEQWVWNKHGFVVTQIEREAFVEVLLAAQQAPSTPGLAAAIDTMTEALRLHDVEAVIEKGRQARRAEAERIARGTPITHVRIRITKTWRGKTGKVFPRGTVLDVERSVHADWDLATGEWTPEVRYTYYPEPANAQGGRFGYAIDGSDAVEI